MKPISQALRLQCADILQKQLIPWATNGAPIALLDVPPKNIDQKQVTVLPGKSLPPLQGTGQIMRLRHWSSENLNSTAIPILGCVIEGEADLEVGITQADCQKLHTDGKRWYIALPQRNFFLVNPGTPISAPGKVHWRRTNPEQAYSRMLWIQIHESGVYCHFNTSDKGKLWISPHLFLQDAHVFPLAHNLIRELQFQSPRHLPIAYFHLGLILEYILRSCLAPSKKEQPTQQENAAISLPPLHSSRHLQDERIQAIIEYIDANLANPTLSTDSLAVRFHLSPAHLRRLFRHALATSPMQFVKERRLEFAQQLLLESSLNIAQISKYCGYKYPPNFTNGFLQHFGESPRDYRKKHSRISDERLE